MDITIKDIADGFEDDINDFPAGFVQKKLTQALALIEKKCPGAMSRVDSGKLDKDLFLMVLENMVFRVLRAPEGFKSESEGNYSYDRFPTAASADLWITDKELEILGCPGKTMFPFGTTGLALDRGWGN